MSISNCRDIVNLNLYSSNVNLTEDKMNSILFVKSYVSENSNTVGSGSFPLGFYHTGLIYMSGIICVTVHFIKNK